MRKAYDKGLPVVGDAPLSAWQVWVTDVEGTVPWRPARMIATTNRVVMMLGDSVVGIAYEHLLGGFQDSGPYRDSPIFLVGEEWFRVRWSEADDLAVRSTLGVGRYCATPRNA